MAKLVDHNVRAAGIAWIRQEDYSALIRIFEDGDVFKGGWSEWLKRAEEVERKLKDDGLVVERVYLDPNTFAEWCRLNGVSTGRDGRLKWGADAAAEKYGKNNS